MENYAVIGRIGEGAHGLVLKGYHTLTEQEVALKKVLLKRVEDGIPNSVIREIKALQNVDCKFVSLVNDKFKILNVYYNLTRYENVYNL